MFLNHVRFLGGPSPLLMFLFFTEMHIVMTVTINSLCTIQPLATVTIYRLCYLASIISNALYESIISLL